MSFVEICRFLYNPAHKHMNRHGWEHNSSCKVFFLLLCQNYYFHGQGWTFTLSFWFYWLKSRDLRHFCLHRTTQWSWNLQCASHRFDISRLKNIQHHRLFPENSVHVPADYSQNRVVCEIVTVYKSTGFMCETVFMMDFLQQDFISLSRNTLILGWLTNTLLVRTLYKLYIFIIIWATQTTFTVIVFGLYFLSLGPM